MLLYNFYYEAEEVGSLESIQNHPYVLVESSLRSRFCWPLKIGPILCSVHWFVLELKWQLIPHFLYTVSKEIDFPRYNMKCSGENVTLRGIFHVSCFPLHFMFCGNLDYFSDNVFSSIPVTWWFHQYRCWRWSGRRSVRMPVSGSRSP